MAQLHSLALPLPSRTSPRPPASPPRLRQLTDAVVRLAAQHVGAAVTLALLAALCALQLLALLRAPAMWLPSAIHIQAMQGQTVILGQRELAAPHADRQHLSLRHDASQGWMLRNLSATRQVIVLRGDREQKLGSAPLQQGSSFQVGGALFRVSAADADNVTLTRAGNTWRYDGATLYRNGQALSGCPDARATTTAIALWNRLVPQALTLARPLAFGGNLYCGNRLGAEYVTPGAAILARNHGRLQLGAGNPDGERAAVLLDGEDLRRQEIPLAGARAVIVGHTRFQLEPTASRLTLIPGSQVSLHGAPDIALPAGVAWDWRQRDLWGAGLSGIWLAVAACVTGLAGMACCAFFTAQGPRTAALPANRANARTTAPFAARLAPYLAATFILSAGVIAMLAQRAGLAPPAAMSLLLGASALAMWLALPGRLALATCAGVVLLAIGMLTQLEMGLGAPQTTWLRYYQKSAALLAIGCGAGGLLRLWARRPGGHTSCISQRNAEWLLAALAILALAGLALQVLWGDEGGVFDLQPVELAKLALAALTAHCLALRFGWHTDAPHPADQGARWLRLVAPVLLFLALLGVALVQVDDFSPLILLLVWCTAMVLAYALIARHSLLMAGTIVLALLAVGAVAWLRLAGGDDLARWGFYADRFLVWLDPARHPHTGQQLLLGARAVAEGGWLGADSWLGLRSLGQNAGAVLQIPAVQDDFAPTFFINRHGLTGALLLWGAQAALLAGIALAAFQAGRQGVAARNYRQAWAARLRYFALCGGGAFLLGHFLLSWGTNLAIFPVMGQPMSFLSAGGSHLLFFLCPLLTFSAISAPSSEGE
jgi:cell division protein FtsW